MHCSNTPEGKADDRASQVCDEAYSVSTEATGAAGTRLQVDLLVEDLLAQGGALLPELLQLRVGAPRAGPSS